MASAPRLRSTASNTGEQAVQHRCRRVTNVVTIMSTEKHWWEFYTKGDYVDTQNKVQFYLVCLLSALKHEGLYRPPGLRLRIEANKGRLWL